MFFPDADTWETQSLQGPRGDVGVEYVLSTPLRVVRGD